MDRHLRLTVRMKRETSDVHKREYAGNLMCVLHVLKRKQKVIMYDYALFFKRQNERDTPSKNYTEIMSIARSISIAQTDEDRRV